VISDGHFELVIGSELVNSD